MTPQEQALLQQNASLTPDLSGASQPEFKSRFDPEIEALQKKYKVTQLTPPAPANPLANTIGRFLGGINAAGQRGLGDFASGLGTMAGAVVEAAALAPQVFGPQGGSQETTQKMQDISKRFFSGGGLKAIQGLGMLGGAPVVGALDAFTTDEQKQAMAGGIQGISNAVDDAFRSAGIDPNSAEVSNIKQGILAGLDVAGLKGASMGAKGAKGLLGQADDLAKQAAGKFFVGKAANTFNNAVGKAVSGIKKSTGKVGDFALNTTSNALWTTPAATMKKIYENGDDFLRAVDDPLAAQASALSRLQSSIDDAFTRTQVGGKGYEALRKSTQKATLPVDGILSKVDDFGLEFVNGKLRPKGGDIMNSRLTADDIAYLNKNVLPELPVGKELTPAQYLNQRKKLDALAKYDMGIPARNDAVRSFVSDMRMTLNDSARSMFEGLAKLDDAASKNIKGLKELRAEFMRKDPVTKQYVLKRDIQPETIANLLSPRNKPRLAVLEKNAPGITRQLEILDLVKQVDRAANITTGAGLKRVGSSMAGGGLAGPVGALAGYLVSDPMMVAKMFARMGAKLGTKQSQVKGGVTAAGETVKGAKETVRSAATTAKGKGKLSTLTQESLNALGQNIQPQPPTQ